VPIQTFVIRRLVKQDSGFRRPYDSGYEVRSPGAAVLGIDAIDKTNAKDNNKRSSNLWKSRHTQNPSIATTAY
jgi:hypothetical protein